MSQDAVASSSLYALLVVGVNGKTVDDPAIAKASTNTSVHVPVPADAVILPVVAM